LPVAYISYCFCSSVECSAFSVGDILDIIEISKLPEFFMEESGPLILAWAVFLCLVQSLLGSNCILVTMVFYHMFALLLQQAMAVYLIIMNAFRKLTIHLIPRGPLSSQHSIIYYDFSALASSRSNVSVLYLVNNIFFASGYCFK
jgi:hypothetical protein